MVGTGGRLTAATPVAATTAVSCSSSSVAVAPPAVLQQLQNHQNLQQLQQQQQHAPPDYTSVAIEKLLHSIWDNKVNDIMAAINHLGLVWTIWMRLCV